jgi:hypothetical protein
MSCNLIELPGAMEAMEGLKERLHGSTGHLGCIVFACRPLRMELGLFVSTAVPLPKSGNRAILILKPSGVQKCRINLLPG